MNPAVTIRTNETIYWKPIRNMRRRLPLPLRAQFPFKYEGRRERSHVPCWIDSGNYACHQCDDSGVSYNVPVGNQWRGESHKSEHLQAYEYFDNAPVIRTSWSRWCRLIRYLRHGVIPSCCLPNTFWVLILRMRTGARAVLKLIRLMQAIMIISNPILTRRIIVLRFPVLR